MGGLFLSGCGGGNDPSISGVVADGYLRGVKICSDRNGNKICDADEPFAFTEAGGKYTLTGDGLDLYPLLVEVGTDAVDEDTDENVKAAYLLAAPKPTVLEVPVVVTPITTLVQGMIEESPALPTAQAVTILQGHFKVSPETDIMADFIAETGEDYDRLHAMARVIASTMGTAQHDIMEAVKKDTSENVQGVMPAIFRLVTKNVIGQIDKGIVPAVIEAQAAAALTPGNPFNPATFDISKVTTTAPETGTITDDIAAAKILPVKKNLQAVFESGGFTWLEIQEGRSGVQAYYGKVSIGADNRFLSEQKQWDQESQQWVDYPRFEMYSLCNGRWIKEDPKETFLKFQADGSAIMYNTESHHSMRTEVSGTDVSGLRMRSLLCSVFVSALKDSSLTFPPESVFYYQTMANLEDSYGVGIWTNPATDEDMNCVKAARDKEPLHHLDEMHTTFAYRSGNSFFLTNDGYKFQFADKNVLKIFNQDETPAGDGTYEEKTVQEQRLLMLHIPEKFKARPGRTLFFAELAGFIKSGSFLPAGGNSGYDDVVTNTTAFEALKENLKTNLK